MENTTYEVPVEVGTVLKELPAKGQYGSYSHKTHFRRKGWDRLCLDAPNMWVCLDTDAMREHTAFYVMSKKYTERYGGLGFSFAVRNIDGMKTLWAKYTLTNDKTI